MASPEEVPISAVFDFGPSTDYSCILFTVEGGKTYEITPEIARKMSEALALCADDVENHVHG
jgi:hypothetical protein